MSQLNSIDTRKDSLIFHVYCDFLYYLFDIIVLVFFNPSFNPKLYRQNSIPTKYHTFKLS